MKFVGMFVAIGCLSPSAKVVYTPQSGMYNVTFTLLQEAKSSGMRVSGMHGGGAAHVGGMRSSGLGRSMMRPSPMRSRYMGGNFPSRRVSIPSKPKLRPVPVRPVSKPISHSSAVQKPTKPIRPSKPTKPVRPDKPTKPIKPNTQHRPPNGGSNHHWHHPHHPHHGHNHHHYYHHYPYHGWGDYWTWFWGSSIVIGAIVSAIPENECSDIDIDGKLYKECDGVLFQPVYQGDSVSYEVVEFDQK